MAIFAVTVLVKEALESACNDVNILGGNEFVQQMPDLRLGAQSAGNMNLESLASLSKLGNESEIVELRVRAIRR